MKLATKIKMHWILWTSLAAVLLVCALGMFAALIGWGALEQFCADALNDSDAVADH